MPNPIAIDPGCLATETWDDKSRGSVSWKTLISSDRTDSSDLVCGLAYFGAGETLARHSHVQAEIVHVVSGSGSARFDHGEAVLTSGTTVFVPGNIEHEFVAGREGLTLFYAFAVSSFSEIDYRF